MVFEHASIRHLASLSFFAEILLWLLVDVALWMWRVVSIWRLCVWTNIGGRIHALLSRRCVWPILEHREPVRHCDSTDRFSSLLRNCMFRQRWVCRHGCRLHRRMYKVGVVISA